MKKLSQLTRPFICVVIVEPNTSSSIKLIDYYENLHDVDAFEINIAQLGNSSLRDIFASTNKPCIADCRRASFMKLYGYESLPVLNSDERAGKLLRALSSGASTIDFELDMFDEKSITDYSRMERVQTYGKNAGFFSEITNKPDAVKKQRKFAKEIREIGGEAMISCHSQARIKPDMILGIARNIESRNADFAKIVTVTSCDPDLAALLYTATKMRRKLAIPFNLMNMGHRTVLGRLLSVAFGSSWIYCRGGSRHGFKSQPTLGEAQEFFRQYL
jgi:3-dehydroquinate dehydratase